MPYMSCEIPDGSKYLEDAMIETFLFPTVLHEECSSCHQRVRISKATATDYFNNIIVSLIIFYVITLKKVHGLILYKFLLNLSS